MPDKDARYGSKAHAAWTQVANLSLNSTPSNANNSKEFPKVINDKSKMTTAGKACDSKRNHRLLKRKKCISAIITKRNRKSHHLKKHQMKPEIIAAQEERLKIDRKFAELKRFQEVKEARYWGLAKVAIQFILTTIACNLKRMVKLLFQSLCPAGSVLKNSHYRITVPISG